MKRFYIITSILASIFLILGIILTVIGNYNAEIDYKSIKEHLQNHDISLLNWIHSDNFSYSEKDLIVHEYSKIDSFDKININANISNITIMQGDEYAIEYSLYTDDVYSIDNNELSLTEHYEDNTLNIWNLFYPDKSKSFIIVYVPDNITLHQTLLNSSVGDISINHCSINNVSITTSTGNSTLDNITCNELDINSSTGNIDCMGQINEKLVASTSTGNIDASNDLRCNMNLNSSTGNIDVTSRYNSECYNINVSTSIGSKNVTKNGGSTLDSANLTLIANSNTGNININFLDFTS